jgi:hypothetical protein
MAIRRTPGPRRMALLAHPDLARWHANVARGSPITADVYARRLAAFCEQMKVEPLGFAKVSDKSLRDLLLDFITEEEGKKRAGSYIESSVKAVKSWLAHNGTKLTLPIRIHGATDTPSLREERTPTQPELRAILLSATPRDRVACALMAFSGTRPEVLGNYRGNDGLRLADIKDLRVKASSVEFEKTPAIVEVRRELSKADHRYFTFLGEEACEYIRQYLEERLRAGEKLTPETDLIHPKGTGGSRDKAFVTTINVGDGVRKSIRGAGFRWRPYVLRAYFDTQLLLAESKGSLAHDYRVFWMGHKGSMEACYTTNKGRLPTELVEDMRGAYRRCEQFLSTVPSKNAGETQAQMSKVMLMGLGYTEEELAKVDFATLEVATFRDLVTKKMGRDAPTESARQRLVDAGELPRYLQEGWRVVTAVNGHQVVVDPPGR